MRTDIEFEATGGTTLRGWLYQPDDASANVPLVVLTHGFSAVKEMGLDDYADVFSRAGMACLVYDHRNFGASDGEPRQDLDPVAQRRDMRYAITYAQTLEGVDRDRIGLWGTSYSGGLAIEVAAVDRRVKAVVVQVPLVQGFANIQRLAPGMEFGGLLANLDAVRASEFEGAEPPMMAVCSDDPSVPHAFPGQRTYDYFHSYLKNGKAPTWRNEVTVRSVDWLIEFEPVAFIERISPTPFLMIVAAEDVSTPADLSLAAYERALEPKELVIIKGDHYQSYLEQFDTTANAARDFFSKHL